MHGAAYLGEWHQCVMQIPRLLVAHANESLRVDKRIKTYRDATHHALSWRAEHPHFPIRHPVDGLSRWAELTPCAERLPHKAVRCALGKPSTPAADVAHATMHAQPHYNRFEYRLGMLLIPSHY